AWPPTYRSLVIAVNVEVFINERMEPLIDPGQVVEHMPTVSIMRGSNLMRWYIQRRNKLIDYFEDDLVG
ncbi:hypothetical protein, partial [Pedobacter sp.]|uniref:hypothetical protein n=1 Tax=Pedobacter sp. TaxID=1411316 RepID=UPI003D7FB157